MAADRDSRVRARVGSVLADKWTLEALIGVGGMAAVYAARHRNGARSAIKLLHPDIGKIPEIRQRFLREGYAANKVVHPGVVKVLDDDVVASGPDEGGAFLVMELLEGLSLEERMRKGPIDELELLRIVRAILDVLVAAHAAGVIHRDLKPENLFLLHPKEGQDARPRVKVLDFGLARLREGSQTIAGLAIGTPSYMPPEQAAGRVVEIDHRADLFALGATAFRILAGRTVHPADGPLEIVLKMAREPAPPLRSVAPSVSAATASVIDRALAFQKEDRFADAASMRAAVDVALGELGDPPIELSLSEAEVVSVAPTLAATPAPPLSTKEESVAEGVDSILQRLDLAPRPLSKRWRIFAATGLAWGGIGIAVALEGGSPSATEARLPIAAPSLSVSAAPSVRASSSAKPHPAPLATPKSTRPH